MEVMDSSGPMMSEAPNPRYVNERFLIDFMRSRLNITDEDMQDTAKVKAMVRDSKIKEVLTD